MNFSADELAALWLSVKLATTVTLLLLVIGSLVAYWLAFTKSLWKGPISAVVALPLVLPPTVIGFYLLIAMGPQGPIGALTQWLGIGLLPFTFSGLVIASLFYSLPFVVQPIQNAIEAIGDQPIEFAATLGAGPVDRFFNVILPLAKPGFTSAAILGFAHTLGEFGVVLMIGGSIPGATKVVSVQLYEHVEALDYAKAHGLALVLLVFSFVVLCIVYTMNKNAKLMRFSKGIR